MATLRVRPLDDADRAWAEDALRELTAGPRIVSRGRLYDGRELPGLVAEYEGRPVGLLAYNMIDDECEVVFVGAVEQGVGAGVALLDEVVRLADDAGCSRAWLVTTNDNTPAIRFYQRQGWDLVALHRDAVKESRLLKPEIPERGADDIPIRHELEFERRLRS
jgi:GNAT superfamily N-acetyltransferase